MLYSMTGYGRSEGSLGAGRNASIDLKALNGKGLDFNLRISPMLRPYELELRSLLGQMLHRGSVDVQINIQQGGTGRPMRINTELAAFYYEGMQQVAATLGIQTEQVLPTIMRMPEMLTVEDQALEESAWLELKALLIRAASHLNESRLREGKVLEDDLLSQIDRIETLLAEIEPYEAERTHRLRQKLNTALEQSGVVADPNRFEQELIYYLERMDFSEEKIRLAEHCRFFREAAAKADPFRGKALGFILQEIGREINTLGSKASNAQIQQIVVGMKEALEKAKEQVLNVL